MLPGARARWRRMGSVDGWPLATPDTEQRGESRALRKPPGRSSAGRALLLGRRSYRTVTGLCSGWMPWGTAEGESGLPRVAPRAQACGAAGGAPSGATSNLEISPRAQARVGQPRRTIVTWLILPVVICLSQRLSHACLSISNYTAKLRMAH